jgi:HSP20 family protein
MLRWAVASTRWDPLQDLLALHERLNRLAGADEAGWMPPVDVSESPDRFTITVEIAGLSRDDIQVTVQDGKLTLKGERPAGDAGSVRFERVERGHGRFNRTFALPAAVDASAVVADLQNGVLTIIIPKVSGRRRIDIE